MNSDILLVQGDSLPLPRNTVKYNRTWPALLKGSLDKFDLVNISQSEKTTDDLFSQQAVHESRELESYDPNILITQIGIVDCAPRYLYSVEKDMFDILPIDPLSRGYFFIAKHLRHRSTGRAYVPKRRFERNMRGYLQRCRRLGIKQVICIHILTAGRKYCKRNPSVETAIQEYNEIFERVAADFNFVETINPLADSKIDEQKIVDDYTISDGYHLNEDGHERLFERLVNRVSE